MPNIERVMNRVRPMYSSTWQEARSPDRPPDAPTWDRRRSQAGQSNAAMPLRKLSFWRTARYGSIPQETCSRAPALNAALPAAIVAVVMLVSPAKASSMKCDGISDDSFAFAESAAAAQAKHMTVLIPEGTCLLNSGLAITLKADLSISGAGTLKVNADAWPYPRVAWLDIDANGHAFSLAGVTLDQAWNTSIRGHPAGFNDGAAPSSWGGNWTIRVSNAARASFTQVTFINIMRGVYLLNSRNIVASRNAFNAPAANATSLWAFENCSPVLLESNSHVGISWLESAAHLTSNGEYSWNSSHLTFRNNFWHGLQIVNRCGTVGACTDILYESNTIDTPVADTSTGNFQHMVARGNYVSNSGDMGITCDNCNFVRITGNTIEGVANGGIAVSTGRVAATGSTDTSIDISDNIIVNPVQDYPAIQTLSGRHSSSAGEWAACITIYTQRPANTVSTNAIISGNRCTMNRAPPVSYQSHPSILRHPPKCREGRNRPGPRFHHLRGGSQDCRQLSNDGQSPSG
jgi:hypothetical protein